MKGNKFNIYLNMFYPFIKKSFYNFFFTIGFIYFFSKLSGFLWPDMYIILFSILVSIVIIITDAYYIYNEK